MKNLILFALIALPSTAFAVENPSKYEAYKQRLAERKAAALIARREYNASKGPHVYRTAVSVHLKPFLAYEEFHVHQPAIPVPVRPVLGINYVAPHHYQTPSVVGYHGNGVQLIGRVR